MIQGEFKCETPFDFQPRCKHVFCANDLDDISIRNIKRESVLNRLMIIPFSGTIPPEVMDEQIVEKWKAEASGILYNALIGVNRLYSRNFVFTKYAMGEDVLSEFNAVTDPMLLDLFDFAEKNCVINQCKADSVERFVRVFNITKKQNLTVAVFSRTYMKPLAMKYHFHHARRRIKGGANP